MKISIVENVPTPLESILELPRASQLTYNAQNQHIYVSSVFVPLYSPHSYQPLGAGDKALPEYMSQFWVHFGVTFW